MSKKPDFTQLQVLKVFVFIGDKNLPAGVSQSLAKIGLNPKQLGTQLVKDCKEWQGARIFVEIHAQNRKATIIPKPGTSAYLIKECEGFQARDRKKEKLEPRCGNLTFDQVLKVARLCEEEEKTLAKTFEGTVKSVLGTALSIGYTVDGANPKEIIEKINSKAYKCQK